MEVRLQLNKFDLTLLKFVWNKIKNLSEHFLLNLKCIMMGWIQAISLKIYFHSIVYFFSCKCNVWRSTKQWYSKVVLMNFTFNHMIVVNEGKLYGLKYIHK